MGGDEPQYVPLKYAASCSEVDLKLLESMIRRGFMGTGIQQGNLVKLDFRWICVLEKAWKMISNETPVIEENVLKALGEMLLRMTDNIIYEMENLKQGHQLVTEDHIKKNIDRYKKDQEFFLEAIEWCNGHRPKIIG